MSLSWWLGVVFVGIVLNVFSTYLKALLDSLLEAVSSKWQARSAEARARREADLNRLKGNLAAQMLLIALEMRHRHRQTMYMLFSLFFLLFYLLIRVRVGSSTAIESDLFLEIFTRLLYWLSLLTVFLSMHAHLLAASASDLLRDANKDGATA